RSACPTLTSFFHLAWRPVQNRRSKKMATLTMIDGQELTFSPSRVSALMDYDAVTHAAVTSVFGLRKGIVFTKEGVKDFMHRVGIADNFAQLTKPDDHLLWVNGDAVSALSLPSSSSPFVKGVRTVVELGSWNLGITETIKQATKEINAHRREPL